MRLAIILDDEVIEVSDCIAEYNLDKPIARQDICERIQQAIASVIPPDVNISLPELLALSRREREKLLSPPRPC